MNKIVIENLLNKLDLTEEEKQFIEESKTAQTADMNQSNIVSDIYLIKSLNRAIHSNKSLVIATWVLAICTIVLAVASIVSFFIR